MSVFVDDRLALGHRSIAARTCSAWTCAECRRPHSTMLAGQLAPSGPALAHAACAWMVWVTVGFGTHAWHGIRALWLMLLLVEEMALIGRVGYARQPSSSRSMDFGVLCGPGLACRRTRHVRSEHTEDRRCVVGAGCYPRHNHLTVSLLLAGRPRGGGRKALGRRRIADCVGANPYEITT